jgi:hypothetical protein
MRTLGEEIAVLDGLDDLGTLDGQSGYRSRVNVLDPTEGANYTGGSDWSPGMPLVMSNAGLADADLAAFAVQTGMPRPAGEQRPRFNVLDPSEGADYTGGSNWTAGMPLVLSNAGLAEDRYSDGTYDGMPLSADFDEHYGSTMDTLEGNFSSRVNVLDPTEGANYTGGSDWSPGMPLVMSNAGLAGLDAVSDDALRKAATRMVGAVRAGSAVRVAGRKPLTNLKSRIEHLRRFLKGPESANLTPQRRAQYLAVLRSHLQTLKAQRNMRGSMLRGALGTNPMRMLGRRTA